MNRQAQSAVLFLLGASQLHAATTDLYLRYVKQGLRPLVLVAGAVLVAAAVATVWYERKRARRQEEHAADHAEGHESSENPENPENPENQESHESHQAHGSHEAHDGQEAHGQEAHDGQEAHGQEAHDGQEDHGQEAHDGQEAHGQEAHGQEAHDGQEDHSHREPRISWLLVLPLLALILVAPPALGSYSATRTGTALQEPLAYPTLPAADPLSLSLVDYAGRAVYDHGRTLRHRQVQLTGFLALDRDGTPYLVRMALNCCAADAQPVKVALTGQVPPVLPPDTWLRVTGTYVPRRAEDPVNGGPIPFIEVTASKPVAAPTDPYDESWNS
ncbi:TIGR03943 family putative permease subunit [Streptomyces sp. NPDC008343]|uniref:TIGR03943 family putative permease subunit n=1 Tax=Streptomyces sp. NPDC008343 TaxID=3364828 RepID=UPI0036E69CDB